MAYFPNIVNAGNCSFRTILFFGLLEKYSIAPKYEDRKISSLYFSSFLINSAVVATYIFVGL
jgi:hypothetical protein